MTDLKFPEWQEPYQEALAESDTKKLHAKILTAEAAIFRRLQQFPEDSDHHEERQAINDAISSLRALATEKLNFPEWKTK